MQGFYIRVELELAIERRRMQLDLRGLKINSAITDRAYQQRAIRAMTESLTAGRRAGLLTMATGTGKTRMAIALVELLMRANWVKRVLFLADRVALVRQASNAFKNHLPDSSPVNLVTDKKSQGRVYLSTYPTMMGLIEEMSGDLRQYGVGHFDLIIVDEAHRSVYQKYGAIFRYFDSYLVGLTATPRDEVDHDTYHLFGLETGVPTDAYSLEEAVADGYLVPPKAHSVPIKFVREGIKYSELSEEEREHWDSLDWGDRAGIDEEERAPDEIHASDVNKRLFNEYTVDLMLEHLMSHGLNVEGGDRIGKTIIFAVNQRHAQFIAQRFNHHYPHHKGEFARVITHAVNYAQSLIDDFSKPNANPHIAISVDMLDTGIDVPEVLNLVFFKAVRSKVKFLQMIGRGTRLSEDLFGPGIDKTEFYIFDFCGNFEYFNENPRGAVGNLVEPLQTRLFKRRLDLIEQMPTEEGERNSNQAETRFRYEQVGDLKGDVIGLLHSEVAAMNLDNFIVRPEGEFVTRYAERENWESLDAGALTDLRNHVAGLPSEREPEDITAKLFDLICLNLQLAIVRRTKDFVTYRNRIIELASQLESKDTIPAVKEQLTLIAEVQSEEYWEDIRLGMVEIVRRKLRGLIQFIDRKSMEPVYTQLTDEIGTESDVQLDDFSTGINLAQYRRKVEAYIRASENHVAIAKLRFNKALTPSDLEELERFVYQSEPVESRQRFEECFGSDKPLTLFIRSLVGLDRNAAKEAFAAFLDSTQYSSQQIRFVDMIIDKLTKGGVMDPGLLYEPPFTGVHHEGLDGVFPDQAAEAIVAVLGEVNARAA